MTRQVDLDGLIAPEALDSGRTALLGRHILSAGLPEDPDADSVYSMNHAVVRDAPRHLTDALVRPAHRVRTATSRELEAVIAFHGTQMVFEDVLDTFSDLERFTLAGLLFDYAELLHHGLNPAHLVAMAGRVPDRFPTSVLVLALAAGLSPAEVDGGCSHRGDPLRALARLRGYTLDTRDEIAWIGT